MKKKILTIYFLLLTLSLFIPLESFYAENDSVIHNANEKYKRHVLTLDYISRKTNSSKYFLNMAKNYCDSMLEVGQDSAWAEAFKEKIELTLVTCENNMNHRIQLFPYFNGLPFFMGFADDAIEYAYDHSLEQLFNTTFIKIHNGPLSAANISSIVTRRDCDDEMFEIVKQTVMGSTDHYVITNDDLVRILGKQKAMDITNGEFDSVSYNLICEEFYLENLGIFEVSNLDQIDEKIWLVESRFSTYSPNLGLSEAVFSRGFCQTKLV